MIVLSPLCRRAVAEQIRRLQPSDECQQEQVLSYAARANLLHRRFGYRRRHSENTSEGRRVWRFGGWSLRFSVRLRNWRV